MSATTREEIREWLKEGRNKKDITHMLVVCDTFDHQDYSTYVCRQENVRKVFNEYNFKNMQKVMEVYSYKISLDDQLNERRAFHFD